ncbi:MAG: metalloprotease TldD [Legionellales bacterium]|jgi:TldD protein|nr:metalloprotease TldD [Legionellales bacterium]
MNILDNVIDNIIKPYDLGCPDLDNLLSLLYVKNCDDADIFIQNVADESWFLEDGIIKDIVCSLDQGAGFRCVVGQGTGYAYSEDFSLPALKKAALAAGSMHVAASGRKQVGIISSLEHNIYYGSDHPLSNITDELKVGMLHEIERLARAHSSKVEKVTASISSRYEQVLIKRFDGQLVADIRPLVRIGLSVVCCDGKDRNSGSASYGGRFGLEKLNTPEKLNMLAAEAVDLALLQFSAKPAPAGEMPVVLGSGWPGVLLHEAVGHGLEGDFNRKGTSAFSGRIGEKVASSACTVIDDATIDDRRGSLTIDDEGTPGERTVLIENGILKAYMHDRLNARLMGSKSTGNGRRESYEYAPMPRMTNTFMEPGSYDPSDIIASVDDGIYAVNFSGGQVDITSGKFVFSANEAYLIKNGKIVHPIKGATLIGDGPSVLHQVSMVGNDFSLDKGIGICGKDGQSVPVGVGQPTMRLDKITVGGTETSA